MPSIVSVTTEKSTLSDLMENIGARNLARINLSDDPFECEDLTTVTATWGGLGLYSIMGVAIFEAGIGYGFDDPNEFVGTTVRCFGLDLEVRGYLPGYGWFVVIQIGEATHG